MTQRLRVLFITPWYPTTSNPVHGVFVREHAKAVQIYDDVVVLHLAGYAEPIKGPWRVQMEEDSQFTEGIVTYRVQHRRLPTAAATHALQLWSALRVARALQRRGFRPDIIHAHIYRAGAPAALMARILHVPMVLTEHSSAFPRRLLSRRQLGVAKLAMAQARVVMPVSLALQRGIEAYGIRASFRIVPNAVDTEIFYPQQLAPRPTDQPARLLFVGSLIQVKGISFLLAALKRIRDHQHDWHLHLVGDGPDREELRTLAVNLGLEARVSFHGIKPKPTVAAMMREADLFLLPSLWENLPCVVIEAMASGLPVIASRVGGIPELVSEQTGVLVPPQDPIKLALAISDVLENPLRFKRDVIAQTAQRYAPAVVGRAIHSIYTSVLS